ncbi:unnamed protein product [Thlaspi arvense]|uniref:Uncharacterized protein n=1 Tax=Thlaspi arvense TaxID=13288 RepID=A0AAU9R778_THLAR|nr:unnamed protein product [Thlaspi arvense]
MRWLESEKRLKWVIPFVTASIKASRIARASTTRAEVTKRLEAWSFSDLPPGNGNVHPNPASREFPITPHPYSTSPPYHPPVEADGGRYCPRFPSKCKRRGIKFQFLLEVTGPGI